MQRLKDFGFARSKYFLKILLYFCGIKMIVTKEKARKIKSNTEDNYNEALASNDPTKITNKEIEDLAKEAIRKFKSLS